MGDLQDRVREEIEEVHGFFVDWITGETDEGALEKVFVPRIDDAMHFVSPDGNRLDRDELVAMFRRCHGANPDFRIAIRDVRILSELGDHLLATYQEWQRGAKTSAKPENGRVTTVVLSRESPFRWLHVHETWLPDTVQAAGPYDF